jgi:hypothetical protein
MMEPMATDALTAAADELYALVPEEFTAARNARAKDAKVDDTALGQRIGEFRKPSPAAWILNQLVRDQPDAVDELLDLGADLRDAQAAGDGRTLTTVGAERRQLIAGLLRQATHIADAADRSPSRAVLDEVEQTLIAATVDEAAGEALRTGRLTRSVQAVGFEAVDLDGAVAGEASAARPRKPRSAKPSAATGTAKKPGTKKGTGDEADEQAGADAAAEREAAAARAAREQADADVQDAKGRLDAAEKALAEAEDLLKAAEWNADELRDERHELETRLKALRSEIVDAERDERDAERVRNKAEIAVDRAKDDVDAAETARDKLS